MPNEIKKANRINVDNLVYAVLEKDDSSGVAYGPVKPFAKAMQVQLTPVTATGNLDGDGVRQESITILKGITAVVEVNKVPINTRAEITGNKYKDGVLVEEAGVEAPYIAFGYRVPQTNKTAEYVWLLKGTAQPYASTVQQSGENINFSTDSITIDFISRDFDNEIRCFGDSADSTFTEEMASTWFEKVPGELGGETTP